MNIHTSAIRILLSASLIAIPFSGIYASGRHSKKFSVVTSPEIPRSVTFAGQEVDLDPVNMYERYDRELTSMAYTHGSTLLTIKRANRLFPVMAPILKEEGVPMDMLYLACIESTLDPMAISGAKAAGLWQFMPATGKEFGLEVNENVDERYHVEKATRAACRYLKQAYAKYGNWESVAASYNGGQGRISSELASQHVDSAFDLYLVPETSRYMFRLLAMKEIMEHPGKYGYRLDAEQLYQPVKYETVIVDSAVKSWPDWAKEHGIDFLTLRTHNPWIRSKTLPNQNGKRYEVLIPAEKSRFRSSGIEKVFNPEWVK
ncbi:MAG: transglycosylase SLT domain-containing protein [Muribaculaceae bacterium]|nr:transglycosylase SLT domain-containing protein [Muribaculaceae bacterium]